GLRQSPENRLGNRPENRVENRPSGTEDDGVHDPPRQQREQARDDQRAGKGRHHHAAVPGHVVTVGPPDAERKHRKREVHSRWIGLNGPTSLIWWIQNELTATAAISATQIQPMVR